MGYRLLALSLLVAIGASAAEVGKDDKDPGPSDGPVRKLFRPSLDGTDPLYVAPPANVEGTQGSLTHDIVTGGSAFGVEGVPDGTPTSETECSPVKMHEPGGSMEGSPVTQQGVTGNCFAHTGAALSTAYLHTKRGVPLDHRTSPEAIYSEILSADPREHLMSANSGRICNSIRVVNQTGSCSADAVIRNFRSTSRNMLMAASYVQAGRRSATSGLPKSARELLRNVPQADASAVGFAASNDAYRNWYDAMLGVYSRYNVGPEAGRAEKLEQAVGLCVALANEFQLPANLVPTVKDLFDVLGNRPEVFATWMTTQACREPGATVRPNPRLPDDCETFGLNDAGDGERIRMNTPEEFRKRMHEMLNGGKRSQPLGIEFCSAVLQRSGNGGGAFIRARQFGMPCAQGNTYKSLSGIATDASDNVCQSMDYLNEDKLAASRNLDPACAFHTAAVVGREWVPGANGKPGKCHFIVQNSWGDGCQLYSGDSRFNYAGVSGKDAQRCNGGRIWVAEDELARNTLRVTRLK